MTKTPEQMAKDYALNLIALDLQSQSQGRESIRDFLAGYQAAKDQLADVSKVMNSPEKPDGWISVKDRLPEVGQRVLIYNPLEYVFIVMADYYNTTRPFFDHITLDDIHLTIYPYEDKQLYWMPLPKLPKEEK